MHNFKAHRQLNERISKKKAKELFGDKLFDVVMGGTEEDTDFEKYAYDKLEKFVSENMTISPDLIKVLKIMRDSKSFFPKILKPNNRRVYRGSVIDEELALEFDAENRGSKMTPLGDTQYYIPKGKQSYYPRKQIQSFTTDIETALWFAKKTESRYYYKRQVIYSVAPDDDFIFSSLFLNIVNAGIGMKKENETIRLSEKPIKAKFLIFPPTTT